MENYSEYLDRTEPTIDRYTKLEKEAEIFKFDIDTLNSKIIQVLESIENTYDEFQLKQLDIEVDRMVEDVEILSKMYYLCLEKLKEL
jgi:hypothetical protein